MMQVTASNARMLRSGSLQLLLTRPLLRNLAENVGRSKYHQLFYDQMLGPSAGAVVNDASFDLADHVRVLESECMIEHAQRPTRSHGPRCGACSKSGITVSCCALRHLLPLPGRAQCCARAKQACKTLKGSRDIGVFAG